MPGLRIYRCVLYYNSTYVDPAAQAIRTCIRKRGSYGFV